MLRVRTRIGPSAISGTGLFAAEPIARGQLVWKYDPRFDVRVDLRDIPEEDTILRDTILHYGYRPGDEPVFIMCGDNARFMNHAPSPNCDDIGDLTIAFRDIAVGEEITCDYAKFDRGFSERDFVKPAAEESQKAA